MNPQTQQRKTKMNRVRKINIKMNTNTIWFLYTNKSQLRNTNSKVEKNETKQKKHEKINNEPP